MAHQRRRDTRRPKQIESRPEALRRGLLLWRYEALARHVRHEDPEVRAWAASRLMQHYAANATDLVAPLLLDEAAGMGEVVAEHLARHGGGQHVPLLERGFRHASGIVPGACLDALGALGHSSLEELAASAVHRRELGEAGSAAILSALLRHGEPGPAREVADALLRSQPVLLSDPIVLRELFTRIGAEEIHGYLGRLREALAWRGADHAAQALQGILEGLEVDDVGWLLHTDRRNLVQAEQTIKSFDSTYDCESRRSLGPAWTARFEAAFQDGSLPSVAGVVDGYCRERVAALGAGTPLPAKIAALVHGLADPAMLQDLERMGPGAASQTVVTLLSCALKLASFRCLQRELEQAGGDLEQLLALVDAESSALMERLPEAITAAVGGDPSARRRAVRHAVETLGMRGPWYGRLVALDVLGRLQAVEEAHEVIQCLWDHHEVVIEAAGRALERMGPGVVVAIRNAYLSHRPEAEALEWMVAAVCQSGTRESLSFVLENLDELMAELDPAFLCDWVSVLGAEELIEVFRDMLSEDTAAVGRALLLVSAIHNRMVPEEEQIRHALHASEGEDPEGGGMTSGSGGSYLM